jgi:hypothetical protein
MGPSSVCDETHDNPENSEAASTRNIRHFSHLHALTHGLASDVMVGKISMLVACASWEQPVISAFGIQIATHTLHFLAVTLLSATVYLSDEGAGVWP